MKQILIAMTLCVGVFSVQAQISSGDLYQGLTQTIPQNRVIIPYGLDVTYNKTSHLIFPSASRYVDLGSNKLIAGKAEDADNVLRVKAAVKEFETETNLSVICNDGSLYTFNVKYTQEPEKLIIKMADFLYTNGQHYPTNRQAIYFKELGNESPILVKLIMQTIWKNNKRAIKHIGCKRFGMQLLLKGLYVHNGLLYFHTRFKNKTRMPYKADFMTFKIVDKKIAKRTAIQERNVQPLRSFNEMREIRGKQTERSVFVLEQFTLPENKQLVVTLFEKNGGRTLSFVLEDRDLLRAKNIDNLKLKL